MSLVNPPLHLSRDRVFRTFPSAALESLLTIAVSQGIVRTYYPSPHRSHLDASGEVKDKLLTYDETSHLDLGILYHRGSVCPHKMFNTESDALRHQHFLKRMESASVDGAVEVRERKNRCWRCRIEARVRGAVKLLDTAVCCGGENDETIRSIDI